MKRKTRKEQSYVITPKGCIYLEVGDEELTDRILNALELQAFRNQSNAIFITNGNWQFIRVQRGK